ncbi:MAG: low molecular weight phosphotyrosine protein phosphatase [Oscillospiraceae bacterium]|nr:low molecular weight phosphotyrosine protein phosphatase [Oscillospiraceae bacterium]
MIKVMFVCHGNICRSPMAEMICKEMAKRRGVADQIMVASSATSTEEIIRGVGNPVYPQARAELERHGIPCLPHRAVQLCWADYEKYDLFLGMDRQNIYHMLQILHTDPMGKIHMAMHFTGNDNDVEDPWYNGRFDVVYEQLTAACAALLDQFTK